MNFRAIVFEDDREIRNPLRRLLEMRGYEVLAFSEPTEWPLYKDPAGQCPPKSDACADIVITDLMMPRMTGTQLFEHQARGGCHVDPRNKAILSAAWTDSERRRAKTLGCRSFQKPFNPAEVFRWLDECERRIPTGRKLADLDTIFGPGRDGKGAPPGC